MAVPAVGVFWGVSAEGGGMTLLADKTPVDQAEPYGEAITHAAGHAEVWEQWARLGAAGLKQRGLPTAPAWRSYEAIPRGRVIFWPAHYRFTILADRRLHGAAFIAMVVAEFGLPAGQYEVQADPHYRPAPDLL